LNEHRLGSFILILSVLSMAALGCRLSGRPARVESQEEGIPRNGLESAEVELRMGAGSLKIQSGTSEFMEGTFTYGDGNYAPLIDYVSTGSGTGELVIEQEELTNFNLNTDYQLTWDLRFSEEIPIELYLALGAGELFLNGKELPLENLVLDMGAGEATVILGEPLQDDFRVSIQGGVGQLNVELPAGVGIRAEAAGGLGDIDVDGLVRSDGEYVTPEEYEGPMILLDIEGGVGQINLSINR